MTLRLEIKSMRDVDAVRLLSMIVRTLGKVDKWQHDDNLYSITFNRDEETEHSRTNNGGLRSRILSDLAAFEDAGKDGASES